MKISGAVIQTRNIIVSTDEKFAATYKGHRIYITTDHGFGKPKHDHLKRYLIDVYGPDGLKAVDSYEDLHNIKDAIRYALKGACLI